MHTDNEKECGNYLCNNSSNCNPTSAACAVCSAPWLNFHFFFLKNKHVFVYCFT